MFLVLNFTRIKWICNLRLVSEIKPPHAFLTLMEGRVVVEAGALMLALPLLRLTARKGHGEPVIVLPGFMADDRSTSILRNYLNQIGYQAIPWGLGTNRQPMLSMLPKLQNKISDVSSQTGQKVRLVGWSRGGMISRELARDNPGQIDRVITIGSPVRGGIGASAIGRWVQRETGLTPLQMSRLTEERSRLPIKVPVRAIYSKSDGVVAWKACIDEQTEDIEHHEVIGSHIGLGSNVEVFRLLPRLLNEW